jgi:pyruvate/2-oxoglutarate dehydrogenase complex dihydrolipoamide acyltransferase (E2) component
MLTPIVMPELGCQGMRLSVWLADIGDQVFEGDGLLEVLAGPATFDVASPASGHLASKLAYPDDWIRPGQVLGTVAVDDSIA